MKGNAFHEMLFIVAPAYNEEDTIKHFIGSWYPIVEEIPDAFLLVVNDGSKDNTLRYLREMSDDKPNLIVLSKQNGGHGDTLLYGYHYAIEHGSNWIFQTDTDGQTNAQEFKAFWAIRHKYDAVFGCRRKRGDGISRKIVESVLCFIIRLIFGVKVPDANCPFRLMRADKVAMYINNLPKHYNLPNVMLTVYFSKHGDRIIFRDITFEKRKGGHNSIDLSKIVHIGVQSIHEFIQFRKKML